MKMYPFCIILAEIAKILQIFVNSLFGPDAGSSLRSVLLAFLYRHDPQHRRDDPDHAYTGRYGVGVAHTVHECIFHTAISYIPGHRITEKAAHSPIQHGCGKSHAHGRTDVSDAHACRTTYAQFIPWDV